MNTHFIKASIRQLTGRQVDKLRKSGLLPAVLYGHGIENKLLMVRLNDFERIYQQISESTLVDLSVEDQPAVKVLIHQVSRDPVSGQLQHVDFYQVRMDEKVRAVVMLEFVGEASAEKNFGATIVKIKDSIEVECLPQDLPSKIEVDLSLLTEVGSFLTVKDLKLPPRVKVLDDLENFVVQAVEERVEEVETPAEAEAEKEAPAVKAEEEKESPEKERLKNKEEVKADKD